MKVYDSQGRLKVVGFTGPAGPPGTQSVTCAELSATASLLSVAIDVVSNGLSALIVDHNILSNRVSANSATGGTGSVTSAEVQVASAAATSADAHAAAASAAATSVDGRVTSLNTFLASISARSVGVSAKGLQSAIDAVSNTISNELSARAASVQTASAAATSADAHANTVSARLASASAELVSLIQIASAAATSADGHANVASAAATSVDARVNSVNVALSTISARSSGVSTHGLQSIVDALSVRIDAATGGGGSVTSTEAQAISAQAASAINVVSARVVSVSAELASLVQIASAAATSADQHVETLSTQFNAFVTDVSLNNPAQYNLINSDTSATFLGSPVIQASASAGSFKLGNASVAGRTDIIGLALNSADPTDIATIQVQGIASVADWTNATGAANLTVGDKYYLGSDNGTLTTTPPAVARPVGIAIDTNRMLLILGLVDDLSSRLSVSVQVASAAATSADNHANTVSARAVSISAELASLVNIVSARVVSVSAELASLLASTSAALRADITSASAVIKADINSVSAAIMADAASHLASTSATIKTDINSVSAAIMADVASHLTSTVAAIRADSTAGSIGALSNAISNDASVSAAIATNISNQYGRGQHTIVSTNAQAIATATFTKVSGLSLSIEGSGFYEIHGQLVWSQSGQGSASAIFNFGMSMTAQPVMAMFRMIGNTGALGAAGALSAFIQFGGNSAICATPSILYSAKPNPAVSGSVTNMMFFDGVLQASTAQSQLKVVAACSTGAFGIAIQPGSYIRCFRIG